MNKPYLKASKLCPVATGAALFLLPQIALGQTSDITCTAAPKCADLGYTKSADQCPDGGMRCPFDSSKMFCVAAGNMDFVFKNQIAVGHVVYSDGTTSANYNANKRPIGIVIYVHHSPQKNHGLIMGLEAPLPRTREEAIIYCNGYSTQGTLPGDWHLPDAGEVWMYSQANPDYTLSQFNTYLANTFGGDSLEIMYSDFFGNGYSGNRSYCGSWSYLSGCSGSSRYSSGVYPWSSSDNFTTTANQILPQLSHNFNHYNSNYKGKYNNFRCVAQL